MAYFDNTHEERLTENEDDTLAEDEPDASGKGKLRKFLKERFTNTKEYRKKKKDALKGRDRKKGWGKSHERKGRRSSGEGTGSHSSHNLQSGQTTVQFSSGGSAAGSLSSLLGLIGSSAGLARADAGAALNTSNQPLVFRSNFQASNHTVSLLREDFRSLKENTGMATEQLAESVGGKSNLDAGIQRTISSSGNGSDIFSSLINTVSAGATDSSNGPEGLNNVPPFAPSGYTYTSPPTFNPSGFFFSPDIIFAFPNSLLLPGPPSIPLPGGSSARAVFPFSGVIDTYLKAVGFEPASTYSYELLSPLVDPGNPGVKSGVTFRSVNNTALFVTVSDDPSVMAANTFGLTLNPKGDLYVVRVTQPISVLFNIKSAGNPDLAVRIDAGPGNLVTDQRGHSGMMIGSFNGGGTFQNTVLRDSTGYTMVGSDTHLLVSNGQVITSNHSFPLSSPTPLDPYTFSYTFLSNTLYRHVGTTDATVPAAPAYGNFGDIIENTPANTITLPDAPSAYTLQMGGNVLDVFGTKYGVANGLTIELPPSSLNPPPTSLINSITLGGNTLAGFGDSYGDLKVLRIDAQSTDPALVPTDIKFNGNVLTVDKNIGSVLYPHLQTLDMEWSSSSTGAAPPANVRIAFGNSIIQGNQGSDALHGDIQNLYNANSVSPYKGFTSRVTVTNTANGHVVTTTTDGYNNSITWGNNVYTGGDPQHPDIHPKDTYHFTLLEDADTHTAVMQGNALITDFKPLDILTFQISPELFKVLSGADGKGYDKQISASDLDASVQLSHFPADSSLIDPLFSQYLNQNGGILAGTTIRFDPDLSGGSITFNGVTFNSFADILYTIDVIYTPDPVTAYSPDPTTPFLYGGPFTRYPGDASIPPVTSPYANGLDNFFANSLYATYSVEGAGVTFTSGKYVVTPGVTIDPFGTITVANTVPILTPLTITATDPQGHKATTTQWFGFLDAPIWVVADEGTTIGLIPQTSISNIISGGANSTLIGGYKTTLALPQTGNTFTNRTQPFGSNLIVSTAGGATAYGDFQTITFTAQGKDNAALSGGDSVSGQITGNKFNFAANAFDVTNGTVYGVAQTFTITGQGGSNASLTGSHDGAATGNVNNNTLTFGPQTIYGSGYLYGDLQEMTISSQAGSGGTSSGSGALDISGHVDHNTFIFNPVQITATGNTGSIYGNLQNLSLNASAAASPVTDSNVTASATVSGNTFTFASNTISGTGVLYGNIQTITLHGLSENASIQSNSFSFGGNHVTGGAYGYVNGAYTLTPNTGMTTLYGNVGSLIITGENSAIDQIRNNSFTFGNDTLTGGSGPNNFYGHLTSFGNTGNPSLYGEKGFYHGVDATVNDGFLTIRDGNGNTITWGNDTYTGGAGVDTYNFTIVGDKGDESTPPLPVMQGFDTITNFNLSADRLVFSLTNPLYISLAGGTILTPQAFLFALMVTQTATDATLLFGDNGDKGKITLSGLGTQTITADALKAALAYDITITPTDPVSALANPSSPVMLFGHTADLKTWSDLFNTPYPLAAVVEGITLNQDGSVNFGTSAIINTTSPTITATDPQGSVTITSDTSAANPVRILALDGTLIDQATGTVYGGVEAAVIRGHGTVIIGGGADIEYGASTSLTGAFHLTDPLPADYAGAATGGTAFSFGDTTPPSTLNYASKLIYDVAQEPNPVIGDVQNITVRVQGLSDTILNAAGVADGTSSPTSATITMADNHIEIVPASLATNFDTQKTYGNAQNISFYGAGGENAYSVSNSYDDARISGNNLTTGNNTITAPGTIYGTAQNLSLTSTDGFYAIQTPLDSSPLPYVENRVEMAGNHFTMGDNTLTGTGSGANILYGDLQSVSLTALGPDTSRQSAAFQAALPASTGLQIGYGLITDNTFDFGHNTLTGGAGNSVLYAGIDQLVIMNEPSSPESTQSYFSNIYSNTFNFQDSTLTATGGITNFHNAINDLSQTNFFNYDVNVKTDNGYVQIIDNQGTGVFTPHDGYIYGNTITFGNDTMIGSATGVNIFNLDLLSTTNGSIVAEGNTTIRNFGAPGAANENMLNLELSRALYEDISHANHDATLITADMLDSYMAAHHGSMTQANGDTVINFSDGTKSLGSITLTGVTLSSFHDLGSNLSITANGTTTIDPPSSDANLYNVTIPGDALSSFTQDAHVVDVSSVGHIVDFAGTIDLTMSNALFRALGLSDANTGAQNLQALENGAHTATGGIAVTTTMTGTGDNAVANTVLTFESTVNGVVNTYGSVTLHDTHFNPADPLNAHLVVTHH